MLNVIYVHTEYKCPVNNVRQNYWVKIQSQNHHR